MVITQNKAKLIKAVREHAVANYTQGWDCVVEAWSDQEILRAVGESFTEKGAISKIGKEVAMYNRYVAEVVGS